MVLGDNLKGKIKEGIQISSEIRSCIKEHQKKKINGICCAKEDYCPNKGKELGYDNMNKIKLYHCDYVYNIPKGKWSKNF